MNKFLEKTCDTTVSLMLTGLGYLPWGVRCHLGHKIGTLVSRFPTKDRTVAALQIKRFLGTDEEDIVRKVYGNFGQSAMESLSLAPLLERHKDYVECDDWPTIKALLSRKQPIIAFTAHTSNWDLLAAYMVKNGVPLTVIGRQARNRSLQRALERIRTRHGVTTLWRSDGSGVRQIISEIKSHRIIAALIDQDTSVTSMHVPFFGVPAKTPASLASLAKKHNALVVTAFIWRVGERKYRVSVKEIDTSLSVAEILTEYNRRLEALIKEVPDQWVWFHKRWRTSQDGTVLSSNKYIELLNNEVSSTENREVTK